MPHKANPVLSTLVRRAALAAPPLGATLHLAAAEAVDERPDGAWHAEWATLRDAAAPHRRRRGPDHRAARRARRCTPTGWRPPSTAARDDVRAEQREHGRAWPADAAADGRRLPRRGRPRSSTPLLDRAPRPPRGDRVTPSITAVRMTGARHRAELPLLVLGPSLGTSATTLWTACAAGLTDAFDVVAWDLPGPRPQPRGPRRAVHDGRAGRRRPARRRRRARRARRGRRHASPTPATRSAARSACSCCSTRPPGSPRPCCSAPAPRSATPALVDRPDRPGQRVRAPRCWSPRSAERWFGAGFLEREPERGSALLHALQAADDAGYVQVCGALAALRRARPARRDRRPGARGRRRRGRRHAARQAARDRRGREGRPVRRARRRRPPRPGRGARRRWPGCSASTCWASASRRRTARRPHRARGPRRRHRRTPRGARRRARRPRDRRRPPTSPATSRS